MIQNEDLASVEGAEISGTDGPLGRAERVYRDDDTGALEWAVLATPAGARFVPLVDGEFTESGVRVPYSAEQVAQSPAADPDAGHLSRGQEADLYLHYGFDYDVSRLIQDRTTGMGAGGDPVGGVVTREGEASGPATGGPHSDDVDTGAVDADHEVRRGVLDAGVERRSPELLEGDGGDTAGAAGFAGAATMGTGPGGTLMGTASTRSAAAPPPRPMSAPATTCMSGRAPSMPTAARRSRATR
jgi:hypothetical protein